MAIKAKRGQMDPQTPPGIVYVPVRVHFLRKQSIAITGISEWVCDQPSLTFKLKNH